MKKLDKIYNNNLLMDNLIHELKTLSLNTVIKNEELANEKETITSLKDSDIYLACMSGTFNLTIFKSIPYNILRTSGIPENFILRYSNNPELIPKEFINDVKSNMIKYTIDNYVEYNDYYRMLNGLPNTNEDGIKLTNGIKGVNTSKYLHDMTNEEIQILENHNILSDIINEYPDAKYLSYLGNKKISIYKARKAERFELIYCPEITNTKLLNQYITGYDKARVYTLKTIYSDAFKFSSDYYDNFISLFIIIQTIIDIIINVPEGIIKREFFDSESIRDMFLSHGIEYFPEIPLRYQIQMIKNLNKLLKFKSTTKNLIDICSIFGFENVSIFKYYLLKDRRVNPDGTYTTPEYIVDENGEMKEDVLSTYDLRFLKIPIDAEPDNYIRDNSNQLSYKDIVNSDEYWYGNGMVESELDRTILEKNFNYVASKYISIDNVYEMNKMSFDMTYFINMVFDNKHLEESLVLPVNDIAVGINFKLTDIICMLYSLMYERIGINDTILDTSNKVMHVLGFNYEANLSQLATYLSDKGYTFEDVGIDKFTIPNSNILSYNDLMSIYATNKDIHDHITTQMFKAEDINIYRIYKTIYEALMVSKINTKNFKTDGVFSYTYTEYLRGRDEILYSTIMNIKSLSGEEKTNEILGMIDAILLSLQQYVDTVDLNFFMSNISTVTGELIKEYLYKLINFFKSHTVQMLSSSMTYTFDNKIDHKIFLFDDITISTIYNLSSQYRYDFLTDRIIINQKEIFKSSNYCLSDSMTLLRVDETPIDDDDEDDENI